MSRIFAYFSSIVDKQIPRIALSRFQCHVSYFSSKLFKMSYKRHNKSFQSTGLERINQRMYKMVYALLSLAVIKTVEEVKVINLKSNEQQIWEFRAVIHNFKDILASKDIVGIDRNA